MRAVQLFVIVVLMIFAFVLTRRRQPLEILADEAARAWTQRAVGGLVAGVDGEAAAREDERGGGEARAIIAFKTTVGKSYREPVMTEKSAAVVVGIFLPLGLGFPSARAEGKPAVRASYFLGESRMRTPDGKLIRTSLSLVKRVVNQAAGRIEEHVLSINDKDAKAFVVTLEVKGKKFTVTERSGSFTGEGELFGEAWKWKGWKSITKLAKGAGTVTSEDKITDEGLSAKKSFAGADGKVIVLFEESLKSISAKTYDILYSKLAPAVKKE